MQIMTDHEGNRKIYLAQGIQEGLKTVDYCQQLTMSCDGKGKSCLNQVLLFNYGPTFC